MAPQNIVQNITAKSASISCPLFSRLCEPGNEGRGPDAHRTGERWANHQGSRSDRDRFAILATGRGKIRQATGRSGHSTQDASLGRVSLAKRHLITKIDLNHDHSVRTRYRQPQMDSEHEGNIHHPGCLRYLNCTRYVPNGLWSVYFITRTKASRRPAFGQSVPSVGV